MSLFAQYKILIIAAAVAVLLIIFGLFMNQSHAELIHTMEITGKPLRPIYGDELKAKREYFASHTSFVFNVLAKVIASPTIKKEAYISLLRGSSMKDAAEDAVKKMPAEEVGLVFEVDGVPVEFTRFSFPYIPSAVAAMMTNLVQKDYVNAQCDKPEYSKRMTCSKIVYIPKKNFLITASNIKNLVEVRDGGGKLIARDYEEIPEEKFREVVESLKNM